MTRTPRRRLRLALLRAFARLTRNRLSSFDFHPLPSAPRILVIRPDHLGDMLFVTPALRILRRRYADARITALVGPWGAPVLINNPHVDQVITLPFPGLSRQSKPSLWQPYGLLRRWAWQLRERYDLALILRFDHWWGALLAYMAAVPQRVGYAVPEVAPFLSHAVPYVAGRHEVEQNLRLVDWEMDHPIELHSTQEIGHRFSRKSGQIDAAESRKISAHLRSSASSLHFPVQEQAVTWAKDLLQNDRPVAIHPGAGAAVKMWRVERWAAVADALAKGTGSRTLLTGSRAERPLCLEIARQMETTTWVVAGETTLDQLAALFARCRLVLGLDSGPLHLAVAMGTPTVHLYGPVDWGTFGPWGASERHRVLVSAWPCVPCNRLDYGPDELAHHPCVREIGVDKVLTAARAALVYGEVRSRKV